ncbi:class-II fumarase/aspartase family protein [Georgenia thermotolerans]|uniref:3-carboxy-cis,cis-muconate cycloisomerase n=1 Tax=Georgenia thermotolerans TaxID=527326 RepID=A0A7J5UTK4_9MICO|nr:adenylosuccinate lyase family protein [Georgenia thermotolerans]KAE8765613.1 3-carboxy-cis,cis-muconate cycloisomerase [Georgenia thermotolerans]
MSLTHEVLAPTPMRAIFSARSQVQHMLDFEAALARSEAALGIIPAEAATAIVACCSSDRYDVADLAERARQAGTTALPVVQALTSAVPEAHRRWVHWGSTTQDVVDSGLMLQAAEGIDLLLAWLAEVGTLTARLADEHRRSVMAGRGFLRHALPVTFGLKAAQWTVGVADLVHRLRRTRNEDLAVQLGGANGTLASLGGRGHELVPLLAADLGLVAPVMPWHSVRDRIGHLAGTVGIVAPIMAKIARDIGLMMQTEVEEVFESTHDRPASTAMPHKRNPVEAMTVVACAQAASGLVGALQSGLVQEHERSLGSWQAEPLLVADLFLATGGAVEALRNSLAHLEVRPEAMRRNLQLTGGLVMSESVVYALAGKVGRTEAFRLVDDAVRAARASGTDFATHLAAEPAITALLDLDELSQALDPYGYLGSTDHFIDEAIGHLDAVLHEEIRTPPC